MRFYDATTSGGKTDGLRRKTPLGRECEDRIQETSGTASIRPLYRFGIFARAEIFAA